MNDEYLIDFDVQNPMLFQPLKKMITYLQYGLLLVSFQISLFIDIYYVLIPLGFIFIFLGLRMVRRAHIYFKIAFHLSIFRLFLQIVYYSLMMLPEYSFNFINMSIHSINILQIVCLFVHYLMIFMIYKSFDKILLDVRHNNHFILCYSVMQLCVCVNFIIDNSFLGFVSIVLFIIFFIMMWKSLNALKKDLLEYKYQVALTPIRIRNSWFFIGYTIIVILSMIITFCFSIHSRFELIENKYRLDKNMVLVDEVKDTKKLHGITVQYHYQIYEKNHRFHHILEYELLNIPKHSYMVETKYLFQYSEFSIEPAIYHYQWVGINDSFNYKSIEDNTIEHGWFMDYDVKRMKAYIDPLNSHMNGVVYFEGVEDKLNILDFSIGLKSSFDFPFEEKVDEGVHLHFVYDFSIVNDKDNVTYFKNEKNVSCYQSE